MWCIIKYIATVQCWVGSRHFGEKEEEVEEAEEEEDEWGEEQDRQDL